MTDMRYFDTGATRNVDTNQPDFEAFLSPTVIERYGAFMHKNRLQRDGKLRDGDNWQKGMPLTSYMKSGWRHFLHWWKLHRNPTESSNDLEDALCAMMFNTMGYLHEVLKRKEMRAQAVGVVPGGTTQEPPTS